MGFLGGGYIPNISSGSIASISDSSESDEEPKSSIHNEFEANDEDFAVAKTVGFAL